jgi:hypothetical protein
MIDTFAEINLDREVGLVLLGVHDRLFRLVELL